jgi:serine O-acetyltransferase
MFTRLRSDIETIFERDPAAKSRWEVLTCYPGLHALILHRLAHGLWGLGFWWLGRFISHLSRFLTGIEIHPAAVIGERVFFDHAMGVVVGETAQIGDGCTIYQGVTLGGTSLYKGVKRHPTLGANVVVGAGAKVLGGFLVGEGAKIGSNAVVTKPVPAGATAIGNPARLILPGEVPQVNPTQVSASPAPIDPEGLVSKALPGLNSANGGIGQEVKDQGPGPGQDSSGNGFSAYGVTQADDPVLQILKDLSEQSLAQSARLAQLEQALEDVRRLQSQGLGH